MRSCFQKPGAPRKSIGSGIEDVTVTIFDACLTRKRPLWWCCRKFCTARCFVERLHATCTFHAPETPLIAPISIGRSLANPNGNGTEGYAFFSSGIYQTAMLMSMQ